MSKYPKVPEDDEFLPPTPEQTDYLRKQEHPYAKLSVTLKDSGGESTVFTTDSRSSAKVTLSKEEFEAECRRIFRHYIPAVERGRLKPHHKDFIARNQNRSGAGRYKLVEALRKYDLSDVPGFEARFNREREDLTEAKLREIERSVPHE